MCPMVRDPMLQPVFSPFRRSQQKTLALVIAGHLAVELGTQLGGALTRFSRVRHNPRLDDQRLTAQLLQLLGRRPPRLIARDWTAWHHDLRMLVAAFSRTPIPRAHNRRETTFVRRLVHPWRSLKPAAVVLGDRGCRRGRWREPRQARRLALVGRLLPEVRVTPGSRGARRLRAWHLHPGQAVDLGGSTGARTAPCRSASWVSGPPTSRSHGGGLPTCSIPWSPSSPSTAGV
jgi:hypothetical protein